jgi:hypothetical protein
MIEHEQGRIDSGPHPRELTAPNLMKQVLEEDVPALQGLREALLKLADSKSGTTRSRRLHDLLKARPHA